ncbi:MAG: M20/M25/M40 family metallo-hydrolase [Acidobacteria bacterium]|nr:M20/M25/M40 family metallo-hydrolase [Acidobacteriota bacterium]
MFRPGPGAVVALGLLFATGGAGCGAATPEPPPKPAAAPLPARFTEAATRIVQAARADEASYRRLQELCDRIGHRSAGTPSYDRAAAWSVEQLKASGMADPRLEEVPINRWERGRESLALLTPGGPRAIPMLGLGKSIGTPAEGITGEVLVVRDFDELERVKDKVKGKIVLYNIAMRERTESFGGYGEAVAYRASGAVRAAEHGAIAALVRSVTTRSMRTPHTGMMSYQDGVPQIPAAAIPIEDAMSFQRMQDRGDRITVRLFMEAKNLPEGPSPNVIAELPGREKPEEIVLIGAHLDSWDVGCGAHDDGAGVTMVIDAARLLKELGLTPRRTVRVVLFTNEERGVDGGRGYAERHRAEAAKHFAAFETDSGGFRPKRIGIGGTDEAVAMVQRYAPLFEPLGPVELGKGGGGADISFLGRDGVPLLGLGTESEHYFDFHHSDADMVEAVDPTDYRESLAAVTLMTFVLGEMDETLPRTPPPPPATAPPPAPGGGK